MTLNSLTNNDMTIKTSRSGCTPREQLNRLVLNLSNAYKTGNQINWFNFSKYTGQQV